MGLLNMVNGKLLLSEKGREYYNTKDVELLYSIIADNILAFGEVVEYLVTSVSPQSEQSVLEYVNDNFDVNWTTYAQVNFRLLWLVNLGKIQKDRRWLYTNLIFTYFLFLASSASYVLLGFLRQHLGSRQRVSSF